MHHITIPLPKRHWCYMPDKNEMTDEAESELIMLGCVLADNPNVLEIGTHRGITTNNMAKMVNALKGRIVTVDVINNPSTIPESQRNECLPSELIGSAIEAKFKPCVTQLLVDPATDYYPEIAEYGPFDFVFLDGDHSVAGVRKDLENIKPMMAPHGVIMLHDVWWDINPPPVEGPLVVLNMWGGYVLNYSHIGILTGQEVVRLRSKIL